MRNAFEELRKKSEELLAGNTAKPMSSGESARKTTSMMDRKTKGSTVMPFAGGAVSVPTEFGGLTPEERQMINTETAKAGIRNRMSQKANKGMYQKEGFTDLLPGGLDGANKRITEGNATLNDLLAAGHRQSRYGGFGTVREEIPDTRIIRSPYGGAREDSTRMRTRDMTEAEYLENFNAPRRKMFEESQARAQALADKNAERDHEMDMGRIKAEGGIEEARLRAETGLSQPFTTISNPQGGGTVDKRTGEYTPAISPREQRIQQFEDDINYATYYMNEADTPEKQARWAKERARLKKEKKEFMANDPAGSSAAGGQGGGESDKEGIAVHETANQAAKEAGLDFYVVGGQKFRVQ